MHVTVAVLSTTNTNIYIYLNIIINTLFTLILSFSYVYNIVIHLIHNRQNKIPYSYPNFPYI